MTVEEIIKTACMYLNKYEDYEKFSSGQTSNETEELSRDFEKLLCAINNINKKIADNLNLFKFNEIVNVIDNKIIYKNLSKKCKSIKKITDVKSNKRISFKSFDEYALLNFKGSINVEYVYYPEDKKELKEEINLKGINKRTFVLGVISEYCFMVGLFDDGEIWEKRFLQELRKEENLHNSIILPSRKWGI